MHKTIVSDYENDIDYTRFDKDANNLKTHFNTTLKHNNKKHVIMTLGDQIITNGKVSNYTSKYFNSISKNNHGANSGEDYRNKLRMKLKEKYQQK